LGGIGVELYLGGHPDELFLRQDLIVPSPGVRWDLPQLEEARRAGVETAGELEIASGELAGRVIGVTGTNGKTTTTALIGHILEGAGLTTLVGGNIGTPVLDMVERTTAQSWSVLELSSFQLEAMRTFRCEVGVVLNVTPDHLDRHGTFEAYAAAKEHLLAAQKTQDVAVLNADDRVCRGYGERTRARTLWFSRSGAVEADVRVEQDWIVQDGRRVCDVELPIRGSHNLETALAATAAAAAAGVQAEAIARGLKSFAAVEHRLELVRTLRGVDYYNDSKATNVDASVKAVESFAGGLWLILGGRDKGSDYGALIEPLRGRLKRALLIGEAAGKIRSQLEGELPLEDHVTLEQAVAVARREAIEGDTVLLAPACASFDQFESYEQRGREFKRLVGELE
jgi:UDP-N-acetylmuramoylalanine--D-glutamate ligase